MGLNPATVLAVSAETLRMVKLKSQALAQTAFQRHCCNIVYRKHLKNSPALINAPPPCFDQLILHNKNAIKLNLSRVISVTNTYKTTSSI